MPFKSEAQRRYLWANEPEIARDWTDTYGSRIAAALGGIMRLGLKRGSGGPAGGATIGSGSKQSGSPASSGGHGGPGPHAGGGGSGPAHLSHNAPPPNVPLRNRIQNEGQAEASLDLMGPAHLSHNIPQQQSQFNLFDYAPFIGKKSLSGMAVRGVGTGIQNLASNFFGPKQPSQTEMYAAMEDAPFNQQKKMYDWGPTPGDGGGQQQQYPPWWYDDDYAQNILDDENEELDIDTSTGDMEEWIQRFRVKDPYRQDRGELDEQIKEYVSKLYTTP
mgnify:CR=1 FL=1